MVENGHAIANPRIDNPGPAVDFAPAANRGSPLDRNAGMDDGVGANDDVAIDVCRSGILDRDPCVHQFCVFLLSHDAADLRQLAAAVDAADFVGIRDEDRLDALPSAPKDCDQVGQVVLVLRVQSGNAANPIEQSAQGKGINTGIDFADFPLRRRRVFFLDDTGNLIAGPYYPAIAVGVVNLGSDDCGSGPR